MTRSALPETPAWLASTEAWLTPRRVRMQALLLALCLWGVCAADLATPGLVDRAGNVKFQDFLPFYVSARMIATGRTSQLYDQQGAAAEMQEIIHQAPIYAKDDHERNTPLRLVLPYLFGPQVALLFAPLSRFSFAAAAWIWVTLSLLAWFTCVYLIWKTCPHLRPHFVMVATSSFAFPALFHCFLRGQISVALLACFTAAYLALRADRSWLAGIALGILIFKPQFLVAIPLVLLLARAWPLFAGLALSAGAQLALTWTYFGPAVIHAYFVTLWHLSRWLGTAELSLAPIQMHSLRAFWSLLIPWPELALALYILSSLVAVAMAAAVWKSASPLALRFSALSLAAVLVNPHLFVYDLVVLAPALLLLVDWTFSKTTLDDPQHILSVAAFRLLVYLAFVLPLFGPLSRWTHFQLSVPAFAALLWVLWRQSSAFSGRELASHESRVV